MQNAECRVQNAGAVKPPRLIDLIIIHCSDSTFGDAATIRRWHTDPPPQGRGWNDIGYHYIILNGCRTKGNYNHPYDGIIEAGRPEEEVGAHCEGMNAHSIGICLIGKGRTDDSQEERGDFTAFQLAALPGLVERLQAKYPGAILQGHYEAQITTQKTCPNVRMGWLRDFIGRGYAVGDIEARRG